MKYSTLSCGNFLVVQNCSVLWAMWLCFCVIFNKKDASASLVLNAIAALLEQDANWEANWRPDHSEQLLLLSKPKWTKHVGRTCLISSSPRMTWANDSDAEEVCPIKKQNKQTKTIIIKKTIHFIKLLQLLQDILILHSNLCGTWGTCDTSDVHIEGVTTFADAEFERGLFMSRVWGFTL